MPRDDHDDEDDFEDDDYEDDRSPAFPVIVRIAGVIWIGYGALLLLGMVFNLIGAGAANANPNAGQANPVGNAPTIVCSLCFGLAFILIGFNTVTGKVKDTLGNSIGSILFGLLSLAIGAVSAVTVNAAAAKVPNAQGAAVLIAAILGVIGLVLIGAGVMALVGRKGYLDWREYHHPKPRRKVRRRPRDDEDD